MNSVPHFTVSENWIPSAAVPTVEAAVVREVRYLMLVISSLLKIHKSQVQWLVHLPTIISQV